MDKPAFPSGSTQQEYWDIRKIVLGVILFLLGSGIVYAAYEYTSPSRASHVLSPQENTIQSVRGEAITPTSPVAEETQSSRVSIPTSDDVLRQIITIKEQIESINVVAIATTSPQIQEVIRQVQALPEAPRNAARDACIQACSSL